MKVRGWHGGLVLFLTLCFVQDIEGAWLGRRHARLRGPSRTQRTNRAAQTSLSTPARVTNPAERPQRFKDLPLNTVFYAWTDREHKYYPWLKVSESSAKTQVNPAAVGGKVVKVPPDLLVIADKTPPKKTKRRKGQA